MVEAAAAIAVAAALSAYTGQQQAASQRKALHAQERAQREAATATQAQQRRAEMESARVNRKKPNIESMLGAEEDAIKKGAASTMLTGPGGVNPATLKLGKTSLLGE